MPKCSVQDMVDFALQPEKVCLEKLCAEVDALTEENKRLAELLLRAGWTQDEVDSLIEGAEKALK